LGIQAEINGRTKHLYSIYRKMVNQNRPLEEIYDLLAIRVIVQTVNDCYAALGVIHSLWKPMPGRFKDYIAMPKPNMYRSLHTTLFGAEGIPFEVQIRTVEMHRTAEYGIAAHWMYKEGRNVQDELDSKLGWLRQALETEDDTESAKEFVDNIMKDFFSEYVFVLTPNGEILDLPTGSTPLDFAYRIHTNVGHHCQHAKVNGVMVRLDYKLKTNDVVEIITSASQAGPSRDWINIVKSQQAKVKIRQWFKKANREENIQKGREMLEEAAKRHGQQLSTLMKQEFYADILKRYNMTSLEDIYATIGYGGLSTGQILHKLLEQYRKTEKQQLLEEKINSLNEGLTTQTAPKPQHSGGSRGIIVKGEPNMVVRFAQCCSPLPGDDIVGYITRGRGVSIHRSDCPNVGDLFREEDRMVPVEWATDVRSTYMANIHISAVDRPGVVMDITQLLMSFDLGISALNAKADKNGSVNVQMSFEVNNASQLTNVIKGLKKIRGINDVYRISN
ncbi:MAG: TGS domain-containing protein, partial [Eubacteriales bacterium]|nr:TGS domain-containing protein [Eubacteriales bacterium]